MRQSNLNLSLFAVSLFAMGQTAFAEGCPELADLANYPADSNLSVHLSVLPEGWLIPVKERFPTNHLSEDTINLVKELTSAFSERGVTLVPLIIPPQELFVSLTTQSGTIDDQLLRDANANYTTVLSDLSQAGLITTDLRHVASPETFFNRQDHHWSPEGAMMAALLMRSTLESNGYEFAEFDSKFALSEPQKDMTPFSFAKIADEICGTGDGLGEIEFTQAINIPNVDSELADDLFGSPAMDEVPITVIGTSFFGGNQDRFHAADGFMYAFQKDVLNLAVVAGRIDTSMINFLSTYGKDQMGGMLIWETVSNDISDRLMQPALRQFIGLMEDPCDPEGIFTQSEEVVLSEDGSGRVLIPLALEDIVEVHAPGLGFGDITLGYKALDGTASSIDIHRSDRLPVESQKDRWVTYVGDPSADDRKGTVITLTDIKVTGNVVPESVTLRMCSSNLR